jgi:hypothetical protein
MDDIPNEQKKMMSTLQKLFYGNYITAHYTNEHPVPIAHITITLRGKELVHAMQHM